MATITPTWTDNVSVISAEVLARGSTSRATLDLRSKRGAMLAVRIGRGGTTALNANLVVVVRRTLNNNGIIHPAAQQQLFSVLTAASSSTVNVDASAAQNEIKIASVSGFAAGDIICIQDSGGGVTRLEWGRVAKATVASGTGLTLDAPLQYAHTSAQADTVRNKAEAWAVWMDGGATYEIIVDYSASGTGESATIEAKAQTYDSDTSV